MKNLTIDVNTTSIIPLFVHSYKYEEQIVEPKNNQKLYYESFQYGSGDIAVINTRDMLHLYEVANYVSLPDNLGRKNCSSQKNNNYANVHGKKIWRRIDMLSILSLAKALEKEPNRSNICPECGDAQVLRWDSAGGGRNITLTSLRHEQCYKK